MGSSRKLKQSVRAVLPTATVSQRPFEAAYDIEFRINDLAFQVSIPHETVEGHTVASLSRFIAAAFGLRV